MSEGRQTTISPRALSKKVTRCPNPDCDKEEGCCVCDHTGWVYEYVLEEMAQPDMLQR
jgi:hypothetical protein